MCSRAYSDLEFGLVQDGSIRVSPVQRPVLWRAVNAELVGASAALGGGGGGEREREREKRIVAFWLRVPRTVKVRQAT